MIRKKAIFIFFTLILFFFRISVAFAQAPNITYASPQNYTVNTAIIQLTPTNTGGAVPANLYGQVTTFAGTGKAGSINGLGTAASFSAPFGLVVDGGGNIYVGDYNNNLIRKITPAGVVTTVAGIAGAYGAVNGSITKATFTLPEGVAVDKAGNIYVADSFDDLIRMITPGGVVSTLAGTAGVAGSANGTGINAAFNSPTGVAVDNAGNVYVADQNNNLIRKVSPAGVVSTLAGTGIIGSTNGAGVNASFKSPTGVAVDNLGNVYVADAGNNLIRVITTAGIVTTLAGSGAIGAADGQGTAATFNNPYGIAVDVSGTVYVADEKNNIIRKISPTGLVSTIAGNGAGGSNNGIATNATFSYPGSIATDGMGNVYVGDINTYLIRKVSLTGYTIDKALPPGLIFDPTTGIITGTPTATSPATDYKVTAYNAGGNSSAIVNIAVLNSTPVIQPPAISYKSPQTYTLNTTITPLSPTNTGGAVPATVYGQVSTYAGNGAAGAANGTSTAASFNSPVSTAVDASGNVYVVDQANYLIRKITPGGTVSTFAGSGAFGYVNGTGTAASFNAPSGITIDAVGNLYLADELNNVIREITPSGVVSTLAGINNKPGSTNGTVGTASFSLPFDIATDGSGNMYVADEYYNLVRKITPGGIVSTLAGNGSAGSANGNGAAASFNGLFGIAVDAAGNIYVSDSGNNLVRKITPGGIVSTFAGSGATGSADGSSTAASFYGPAGIAIDAIGNIYVADDGNDLIRVIDPSGNVSTVAGSSRGYLDGTGSQAMFNNPVGLSMDASRNLYVADQVDNHIRKVITTGYKINMPLPSGLTFDATTGIISGTPTVASSATDYTITAYNLGGSSTTTVNITVILAATITFSPIPPKTVCDPDFDPGASVVTPATTLNPPITYTSSNAAVATIVAGKIHITGAGTSIITATEGALVAMQMLTVSAALAPAITISPAAIDTCQGSAATYTATIADGGTNPVYQWQVNGQNSGTNSPQFTSSNLNDNDKITCTLTSNALCTTNATATSNVATFNIYTPGPTSVNIISTANGPICPGTEVDFIATVSTPDNNPTYQWQVNGVNVGINSQTFGSTSLGNGDVVTCILISNAKCLVNPDAMSNAITISLNPLSTCIISIPNTFTPNGDGINDLWNITALQGYPTCTVNIYNRYGALVYNSIGYPKPWDGSYNGGTLPVGTYYYVIDLKNGKKKLAGPITILR
jgi:gliding motility-associated-like protein